MTGINRDLCAVLLRFIIVAVRHPVPVQTDIIQRLGGGGQAGRAIAAEKALEQIKAEGSLVQKPFVPKKRTFAFPNPERMGQRVLEIVNLTHGYGDRRLFDDVSLEMEKGERVALIGESRRPAPS